jgi:hypothetical protein
MIRKRKLPVDQGAEMVSEVGNTRKTISGQFHDIPVATPDILYGYSFMTQISLSQ